MRNALRSELTKLGGLPVAAATALATVGVAIVLAAGIAASARTPVSPQQTMIAIVPFLQIGSILLGVLTAGTEYQGSQIRTTLTGVPRRLRLLTAKALAYLIVAALTGVVAIGGALASAAIALGLRGTAPAEQTSAWPSVGAAVYLVMIGLLALAVSVLLRSLVAPLVTMLGLVLIVSPLLAARTEHARWLPDRAGGLLYLPGGDSVLTPGSGALVLLAWTAVAGVTAAVVFVARDA